MDRWIDFIPVGEFIAIARFVSGVNALRFVSFRDGVANLRPGVTDGRGGKAFST
jgi:hypothetical protein